MPPILLPESFNEDWSQRLRNLEVAALDIDDTLLTSDKNLAPETVSALDEWLQSGKQVVLATGRPPRMVQEIPGLDYTFPAVCYNGCWVEYEGEVLYKNHIPAEITQDFVNLVLDCAPSLWIGIESEDTLFEPFKLRSWRDSVVCDVREIRQPAMKIIFRKSLLESRQLEYILEHLPRSCDVLISDLYDLIQIMNAGADKVQGVSWWLKSQGLELRQTLAIGDDTNDTQLVSQAQLGVAMENAVQEVQTVADFVTASNDEGGVARVLRTVLDVVRTVRQGT